MTIRFANHMVRQIINLLISVVDDEDGEESQKNSFESKLHAITKSSAIFELDYGRGSRTISVVDLPMAELFIS